MLRAQAASMHLFHTVGDLRCAQSGRSVLVPNDLVRLLSYRQVPTASSARPAHPLGGGLVRGREVNVLGRRHS